MRQITLKLLYAFALIAAVTGSHGVAYAQCTVPPGNAGEQFYNTTHNVMQYCNGSDWVNMGAIGGGGGGSGAGAPMIDQFAAADPPPLNWSDSKYGFLPEEDCNAEEETQAGRDRRQATSG